MSEQQPAPGPDVPMDTLVRGPRGWTDQQVTGRVYRPQQYGWLAIVTEEGGQAIIEDGAWQVVGPPRPVKQRGSIPQHLRHYAEHGGR